MSSNLIYNLSLFSNPPEYSATTMTTLPTLDNIRDGVSSPTSPLALTLDTLFEHSPILVNTLEPSLNIIIKSNPPLKTYGSLIDLALEEIGKWDIEAQAEFISGHPRIGENKGLSTLSATEQGAQGIQPTPPEVLARLKQLNALYEEKYPGLRYITFVNGRTRAEIAEEMEVKLGISQSSTDLDSAGERTQSVEFDSEEWRYELHRAIHDIGRIAKSRLRALGAN